MKTKGISAKALNQQATAAGLQQATAGVRTSPRKGNKGNRKKSNTEASTDATPAVMVELAEEEGDQTPYFNPFQK